MTNRSAADELQRAGIANTTGLVRDFITLLESDDDVDRILDGYEQMRRTLVQSLASRAQKATGSTREALDAARLAVQAEMQRSYGSALPDDIVQVAKYGRTHALLLTYLLQRVGRPVPAARLRALVADQVHTERRVRELRDLGYDVVAEVVAGSQQYLLASARQDVAFAALANLRRNVRRTRHHSGAQKAEFLKLLER